MSKTKGKSKLTERQLKAVPSIVSSPTYTEGCKKAKINKTTLYKWLTKPKFKAELNRQREQVASEAFGVLSQNLTRAVEALVHLLDVKDDRLKRLTAKDIIEHFLKYKENEELEERIAAIEARLEARG
ncbi:MAG: phBC6A51 family helix-turn-helix protein [Planctomycetota bacterium]|jgi:hypothetical protein